MKNKLILLGFITLMNFTSFVAQTSSYYPNNDAVNGARNCGFGWNSLLNNFPVPGDNNTAVGYVALTNNTGTMAAHNTAVGSEALTNNLSGGANTAVGSGALLNNNTSFNTAIGRAAMYWNTLGKYNSATGYNALFNNTLGTSNTANGFFSLYSNTTGTANTAIGAESLQANTTGSYNVACGVGAAVMNTTGNDNTACGASALNSNASGIRNVAVGRNAVGSSLTSGNTGVGYFSLFTNQTGINNTALGSGADVLAINLNNATAIGANAIVNASNRVWLGNPGVLSVWCTSATYLSDGRFKSNITDNEIKGLEFIKLLRPVVYNLESRQLAEFMCKNMPDSIKRNHLDADFAPASNIRQSGFIAQEVEAAAKQCNFNFSGIHSPENENDTYGISYQLFVVPLVKGMQEQQAMIEQMQQQINSQQQTISDLMKKSNSTTGVLGNEQYDDEITFMKQNEPNPFTLETTIRYSIPSTVKKADLVIYDLSGKKITSFPIEQKGNSSITINSTQLPAGIYLYSFVTDGKIIDTKRMVVTD